MAAASEEAIKQFSVLMEQRESALALLSIVRFREGNGMKAGLSPLSSLPAILVSEMRPCFLLCFLQ